MKIKNSSLLVKEALNEIKTINEGEAFNLFSEKK